MHNNPSITFTLEATFLECLNRVIESQMEFPGESDDDRLVLSTLWEIRCKIAVKLAADIRIRHKLKLSASQGYAMRVLYTSVTGGDMWFMNELRKIADKVHNTYA